MARSFVNVIEDVGPLTVLLSVGLERERRSRLHEPARSVERIVRLQAITTEDDDSVVRRVLRELLLFVRAGRLVEVQPADRPEVLRIELRFAEDLRAGETDARDVLP